MSVGVESTVSKNSSAAGATYLMGPTHCTRQQKRAAGQTASSTAAPRATAPEGTARTPGPKRSHKQVLTSTKSVLQLISHYHESMTTLLTYRAASDKRIEIDKQKREAIELHKQKELQAQKADVMSWQETVATPGI